MPSVKIPPHDEQAESSVLGAILIDKDAISEVIDFLRPEFFYRDANHYIFEAMLLLFEKHEPVDIVTVTSQLKKIGKYKEVGGSSYLSELTNIVPTSANIEVYGQIVTDHFVKRRLIEASAKISEVAFDEKEEAKFALDQAESEILAISQHRSHRDFIPIKEALAESFD